MEEPNGEAGASLHSILSPLLLMLVLLLLMTDVIYLLSRVPIWAQLSFYVAIAGAAAGVLVAIFSLMDLLLDGALRLQRTSWLQLATYLMVIGLMLVNLTLRSTVNPSLNVLPWGLSLSMVAGLAVIRAQLYRPMAPVTVR
jgi:uncharacterized membrane protein